VSSDSIVKGIIDDIINTAVKTAEVDRDWMIYPKHPIRSLLTSMLRKANIRYPSDVYTFVSSDSIVKGIIDDIINTAVKTAEVDKQNTKYLQHFILPPTFENDGYLHISSTSEKIAYMYTFKIMLDTSVIQ
jgi:hypothetical protein